ncbi:MULTISPECIES: sugar kinase [unclassified Azospirillum]|uniref:sugar kinase n=1 Tax=unclassified Azospirillum TaxID=2630922 RepID=UPI000B656F47|nr:MULTISPECIES: sugar kinase [unclassified Azospirillum]SNS44291.1 2-dehydro-3-deoxygluconokinase [Azospirillum sp. RU38E]SNS63186.1 2-dehydro-3-deoxygluconokinase [Azospirillum sp. RU37A]
MAARFVFFGELLLRLSAPGRQMFLQTPGFEVNVGGAEANVAVSLSRFGHECAMVGTVPDHALGEAAIGELRRQGVDTRAVRRVPGRMGLYFLATGALSRPSEIIYDRVDTAFALADADHYDWAALVQGAERLHLSGVTPAVSETAGRAALAAAKAAVEAGVKVSFDCNYRQKLWEARGTDGRATLLELAGHADLLLGNHRDIALMLQTSFNQPSTEEKFLAAAETAFQAFPRLQRLACTIRSHESVDCQDLAGQMISRGGALVRTPVRAMSGIVDRIGGGDAFAAGLLHGITSGMDDATALDFAVCAALLKHSVPGDANLVSVGDVQAVMAGGGLDVKR